MTLLAGDTGLGRLFEDERRAPAVAPRRSWASPVPYVPSDASTSRPVSSWRRAVAGYSMATLASDAANAFLVVGLLSLPKGVPAAVLTGLIAAAAYVVIVALVGGYARGSLGSAANEFQSALRGVLVLGLSVMFAGFVVGSAVPRRLVLIGMPVLALLSWMDRFRRRKRLHHRRAQRGEAMANTLVVGEPFAATRVLQQLGDTPHQGFAPVGVCIPDPSSTETVADVPVLGGVADIVQLVVDHGVDVVVVTSSTLTGDALRRLSWALGRVRAELVVAPELIDVASPRLRPRDVGGMTLLEVEVGAPRLRLIAKSALDRVLGSVILAVASPFIAISALLVKVTSPGGAFFRQTRVGLDGQTFTMLKLRSMYSDAEARKAALMAQSDGDGLLFKMRNDPRITPIGKWLRRFSIDELPQLWNVVRGDMSLVGPRPPLLDEVALYPDHVGRRLHVRPGLTGLWQVSGRSDLDWDSAVALDLRYVDNWSVTMDLMILWKTARAVLKPSGAY